MSKRSSLRSREVKNFSTSVGAGARGARFHRAAPGPIPKIGPVRRQRPASRQRKRKVRMNAPPDPREDPPAIPVIGLLVGSTPRSNVRHSRQRTRRPWARTRPIFFPRSDNYPGITDVRAVGQARTAGVRPVRVKDSARARRSASPGRHCGQPSCAYVNGEIATYWKRTPGRRTGLSLMAACRKSTTQPKQGDQMRNLRFALRERRYGRSRPLDSVATIEPVSNRPERGSLARQETCSAAKPNTSPAGEGTGRRRRRCRLARS